MTQSAKNSSKPSGKNILLGVCGGIAAYKSPDLVRRLKERGFEVRVVMTEAAKAFITPLTLQAVSANPVHHDLFDPEQEAAMGHIELARWADLILIAPTTANSIAKIAHGHADSLLTSLILASKAPLFIAPAMNQQMWANQATQDNIKQLRSRNITIFGPAIGEQACGDVGAGRMLEPIEIADELLSHLTAEKTLTGKRLLITAGPTIEAIDPVRFISNHSSGKMGFALAEAAHLAGAEVTVVSGPVNLNLTAAIRQVKVSSAAEMFAAVKSHVTGQDIFIGCAAVADYTPEVVAEQKIKKNDEQLTLRLKRNPDILAWVAAQKDRPFTVGFAAESQSVKQFALQKLTKKDLDLICANDISNQEIGFNSDHNQILVLDRAGNETLLAVASKKQLAQQIIEKITLALQSL